MENKIRHIVILVPPNPTILSIAGPLEIFARAIDMLNKNNLGFEFHYELHIISADENKKIKTSSGLPVITEGNCQTINNPIDTLIIAGMASLSDFIVSTDVLQRIKELSLSVKRIASICTGTFILAKAGYLENISSSLAQIFHRSTKTEVCTSALLLPIPCYAFALLSVR